jgi:glucose 1-dehydrogenase
MRGIDGKVGIVTGGSSGIGQAIPIRLAEDGANVAINYVGYPDGAESTRDAIERGKDSCMCAMRDAGVHPMLVAADVSQEDEVERMFKEVIAEYGRVDFLVNNAGIQFAADTHELPVDSFDKVLAVNLRGAFLCARVDSDAPLRWTRNGVIGRVGRGGCCGHVRERVGRR